MKKQNVDEADTEDNTNIVVMLVGISDETHDILVKTLMPEFSFIIAEKGTPLLNQVRDNNPDIVLSDYLMPDMNGDEICRKLKSHVETSHIPVVFLSALTDSADIIYALEAGASDYITVPFNANVLKARLKNIIMRRKEVRNKLLGVSDEINTETDYTSSLDKQFLDKLNKIVSEHLSDADMAMNDIYMEIGMSRTSVYNKLKSLTGKSPSDYVRIIRLNKAYELLKQHRYPIVEVAVKVGYNDSKYFSTSFKKQFGISPSKV